MGIVQDRKRMVIFLARELQQWLKITAIRKGQSVSDYITNLLLSEQRKDEEYKERKTSK